MGAEAGRLAMQLAFEADHRPEHEADRQPPDQLELEVEAEFWGQVRASSGSGAATLPGEPTSNDHQLEIQA
jgi:hypothetical protein